MKAFFKILFCKHDYAYTGQKIIKDGTCKMVRHECQKCGKEKFYFV